MASLTAVLSMVGVILLTVLGTGLADKCDTASTQDIATQNTIRTTLTTELNTDQVQFKNLNANNNLVNNGSPKSKIDICNMITDHHTALNGDFLGAKIASADCQTAFTNPAPADLTKWAGKHTFVAGTLVADDAIWATPTSSPVTQSMIYFNRNSPCCLAYNRIVTSGDKIEGYDPLDNVGNYNCNQGTYVAYPFTVSAPVDCMVKVTRTNAFLECIKHGTSPKKRTSAGLFGGYYAHYNVEPLTSTSP